MLKSLRDGAKSPVMRVFLVVLAIGFALWGIDDVFRAVGSSDKAVVVGDVEVPAVDAAREFERFRRRFMPGSGASEAVASGLLGNVLSGLLRESLFVAEAGRMGLAVTRTMEKDALASEAAFADDSGRFSPILFNDALAQSGLGEAEYLAALRRDLMRRQLMDAINGGMSYHPAAAEALARWRLERRSVRHATIPVDPGALDDPDESAVGAWYAGNSTTFDSPDLRFATVVLADPEVFLDDVVVDEAALAEAYDERADLYQRPERRVVRQMILGTAEEAGRAVGRLRGGEDFAALAGELRGLSADDVDLGEVTEGELTEELAGAVFGLAAPGIAEPVESPLGHHVVEVARIVPAATVPFDEARDSLVDILSLELATDLVYERVNSIDEALAAGSTLEEAAREAGAVLATLDGMDRNGRDRDGAPVAGALAALATDTAFRESVWTGAVGEPGIIEESGDDGFFVVRVDREEAARPQALDEVRDLVVASMKRERAIAAARGQAAAIAGAADPAAAAAAAGHPLSAEATVRRDGVGLDHASARLIAGRAFELDAGETGYVETGSEVIVVATTGVTEADGAAAREEGARFGGRLATEMLISTELAVLRGLEERFDIRVNPAIVQQILVGAPEQ